MEKLEKTLLGEEIQNKVINDKYTITNGTPFLFFLFGNTPPLLLVAHAGRTTKIIVTPMIRSRDSALLRPRRFKKIEFIDGN